MPPVKKLKKEVKPSKSESEATPTVVSGQLEKKIKKQEAKKASERGVVFIKHLPHGFFEEQLKKYFSQFGKITRLRLARSTRTGGSKGFAFIEFEYPEVAQVAAETMDNYLMFKKLVKATYIPPEKQRFNLFKTSVRKVKNKAGKEIYVSHKTASIQRRVKLFNDWSDDKYQKRTLSKLQKIKKLNEKFGHFGIDFTKYMVGPKMITTDDNQDEDMVGAGCSKQELKQKKKDIKLEDLLGNTLEEDSEDDDYVDVSDEEDDEKLNLKKQKIELADLLGNTLDDDTEDEDYEVTLENEEDEDKGGSEDETSDKKTSSKIFNAKKSNKNKSKLISGQSNKPKLEGIEKLCIRKQPTNGINKKKQKIEKKKLKSTVKKAKQVELAKQIAKPLTKLHNKTNLKIKVVKKEKV